MHVSKMVKLKNSILPIEEENALHVYWTREFYVATKCWQQSHSESTDKVNI